MFSLKRYIFSCEQGLLRQLVLVPGSDATHFICPSSKPQLAALSVPPLLSDLSVTGKDGDSHVTTYSKLMYFLQHVTVSPKTDFNCSVCSFASLIVCLSLCFVPELSEIGERVQIGLERSCSVLQQGQLWFDPVRKGLYLCDGTVWITVLEGENPPSAPFSPASLCSA